MNQAVTARRRPRVTLDADLTRLGQRLGVSHSTLPGLYIPSEVRPHKSLIQRPSLASLCRDGRRGLIGQLALGGEPKDACDVAEELGGLLLAGGQKLSLLRKMQQVLFISTPAPAKL